MKLRAQAVPNAVKKLAQTTGAASKMVQNFLRDEERWDPDHAQIMSIAYLAWCFRRVEVYLGPGRVGRRGVATEAVVNGGWWFGFCDYWLVVSSKWTPLNVLDGLPPVYLTCWYMNNTWEFFWVFARPRKQLSFFKVFSSFGWLNHQPVWCSMLIHRWEKTTSKDTIFVNGDHMTLATSCNFDNFVLLGGTHFRKVWKQCDLATGISFRFGSVENNLVTTPDRVGIPRATVSRYIVRRGTAQFLGASVLSLAFISRPPLVVLQLWRWVRRQADGLGAGEPARPPEKTAAEGSQYHTRRNSCAKLAFDLHSKNSKFNCPLRSFFSIRWVFRTKV